MKNRSSFRSKKDTNTRGPSRRGEAPAKATSSRVPQDRNPAAMRHRDPEIPKAWRIVPGNHAIMEALAVRPKGIRQLWLRQGWESSQDLQIIQQKVQNLRVQVEVKPVSVLDRICATHQGAVLYVEGRPELSMQKLQNEEHSILVYLDGIEDPHNLGAILRTSWLVGAHGLFIPEERAVGLTPTAHKVACGGAEHVPVEEVGNFANRSEELKKMGYWVFGLSHKAKRTLFDIQIPEKVIWAIGSEDRGLRVTTERLCDELVSIPQISAAASYNASVATAMALSESMRKHSLQHGNSKKS